MSPVHLASAALFIAGLILGAVAGAEWHKQKIDMTFNELQRLLDRFKRLESADMRLNLRLSRRLAALSGALDEADASLMLKAKLLRVASWRGRLILQWRAASLDVGGAQHQALS